MKRREFITLVGGAVAVWPLAAHAQQAAMPVIGFIRTTTAADSEEPRDRVPPGPEGSRLHRGPERRGRIPLGRENQPDRLPALVADLICRPVAVIVGNSPAALAAKAATTTVPIVFAYGGDPVRDGLVTSLNWPDGNVTGVVFIAGVLGAKRLELLRQIAPKATTIAFLVSPNSAETEAERRDVQAAAQALGQQLIILDANSDREIETAFAMFVQRGAGALLVGTGTFSFANRERLVAHGGSSCPAGELFLA